MIYTIYANKAEESRRKLDKIAKKAEKYGVNFGYTFGNEHPETVRAMDTDGRTAWASETYTVAAVDVSIDCDTLICANGWRVLAQIEHGVHGNIVTTYNCEAVPAWYTLAPHCDHCNTIRNRNTTYIVGREDGVQKQVGKSCLKEYTGIAPETAILFASVHDYFINDSVIYETARIADKMYNVTTVIALAIDSITSYGYVKSTEPGSTKSAVADAIRQHIDPSGKATEKARKVIAWLTSLPDDYTGPERDCKSLALSGYCKYAHLGRLAYMPLAYDRDQARKAREAARQAEQNAEKCSEYVGNVGEKVTFKAEKATLLTSWETAYGYTYLYKFVCKNNVFIWFASRAVNVSDGATIAGTIKEHSTREGVKQTVLTRCKVK